MKAWLAGCVWSRIGGLGFCLFFHRYLFITTSSFAITFSFPSHCSSTTAKKQRWHLVLILLHLTVSVTTHLPKCPSTPFAWSHGHFLLSILNFFCAVI
uniref:Uncharacterized protein n=1 Tax=Populus trichocarpa TaxID=3694 RepID=A0A3N7FYP9_POPTR